MAGHHIQQAVVSCNNKLINSQINKLISGLHKEDPLAAQQSFDAGSELADINSNIGCLSTCAQAEPKLTAIGG